MQVRLFFKIITVWKPEIMLFYCKCLYDTSSFFLLALSFDLLKHNYQLSIFRFFFFFFSAISVTYKNERNFSQHPKHKLFQDIFTALVKNRFNCRSVY